MKIPLTIHIPGYSQMSLINCRKCDAPHPASAYNSVTRPTCPTCLSKRREAKAARRASGEFPLKPKAKVKRPAGTTYGARDRILRHLGFSSYSAYLKSDLWEKARSKTFTIKGRQCYLCPAKATQVHHMRYDIPTLLGKRVKHLMPVCAGCHRAIEFLDGKKIRQMQDAGKRFRVVRRQWCVTKPAKPAENERLRVAYATHHDLDKAFRELHI